MWLAWRLDHCKWKHSCPAWSLLSAAKHFYPDGSSRFQDDSLSLQKDTRGHWLVWRAWKWCKSYLIRVIVAQNRPLGSDYISREQWSAYTRLIFIEICSCLLYLSKWNSIQPKRLKKINVITVLLIFLSALAKILLGSSQKWCLISPDVFKKRQINIKAYQTSSGGTLWLGALLGHVGVCLVFFYLICGLFSFISEHSLL